MTRRRRAEEELFVKRIIPDRLLEISERVYVLDCCFSTDPDSMADEDGFRDYFREILVQLQEFSPDASLLLSTFSGAGDSNSRIVSAVLSEHDDVAVLEYPRQYGSGCLVLQLEMIHHFLVSCGKWLERRHNVLLMHCNGSGGWSVVAFMLAALLLHRKAFDAGGEQTALEMVYNQAPSWDLIYKSCPLNPQPSHLRYLHYITSGGVEWPPVSPTRISYSRLLILDSLILHVVPRFDTILRGNSPYLRVSTQYSLPVPDGNRSAKVLSQKKILQGYSYEHRKEVPVKISVVRPVQGDVMLECVDIFDEKETIMFRVTFNTAFVQSNILILYHEDIDVAWNSINLIPTDLKAEILFLDPCLKPAVATKVSDDGDGDETHVSSVDTGEELYEAENDGHTTTRDSEIQSIDDRVSLDGIAELDSRLANEKRSRWAQISAPITGMDSGYEKELLDKSAKAISLPLEFLKAITHNFSTELEIGRGAYGVVYKGILGSGRTIAVKKLKIVQLDSVEFEREVINLEGIKHQNVIRLVGFCAETKKELFLLDGKRIFADVQTQLLCFEYLSNGSLDNYISDESSGLDWNSRYKIIKGICVGLCFLYKEHKIVHLDLKPQNILMDDDMIPKIADFGLSKLLGEQNSRTMTLSANVKGTLGYMAPEYLFYGKISHKADIFSLGVIIVEILTGRKEYPCVFQRSEMSLREFAGKVLGSWRAIFLADSKYSSVEMYTQKVEKCINIALKCVDPVVEGRPNASDIIEALDI